MNEDRELMDFVRDRLEGDVPRDVPRLDEITRFAAEQSFVRAAESRSRSRLWGASLAAACVAAVCAFAVLHVQTASPSPEATVASVIDMLRMADGAEDASEGVSVAEMLLAWQDAPYESAISGLVSGN